MGKKNEKINAVKQYIENIAGIYTSYSYGEIPNSIITNACISYGGNINKQDILGIIDTTVFGNGKKGIIFAENRLYYNYGYGQMGSKSYKQIYDSGQISGDIYYSAFNKNALTELVSELANIEGMTLSDTLNSINQDMQDISDVIDEGISWFRKGKELFNSLTNSNISEDAKNEESNNLMDNSLNQTFETGDTNLEVNNDNLEKAEENILCYKLDEALQILNSEDEKIGRVVFLKAFCYLNKLDIDGKYDDEIRRLLEMGYRLQNTLATVLYGLLFLEEHEAERMLKPHIGELIKLASKGDAFAQYEYANYLLDYGNAEEAFRWMKMADENGLFAASLEVGKMYEYGEGIEMNEEEAYTYYSIVATLYGVPTAKMLLADCFYYGTGVEEDEERALELYEEYFNDCLEKEFIYEEDENIINRLFEFAVKIPNISEVAYNMAAIETEDDDGEHFGQLEKVGLYQIAALADNPRANYEMAMYCIAEQIGYLEGNWLSDAQVYLEHAEENAGSDIELIKEITELKTRILCGEFGE